WVGEQLASLAAQELDDWALWVSDDGSTDGTMAVLEAFRAERQGKNEVTIVEGPGAGSAALNFLHLLTRPELPLGPRTVVALCDQDDVWLPEKLGRGLALLADAAEDVPLLYGAQAILVDRAGQPS